MGKEAPLPEIQSFPKTNPSQGSAALVLTHLLLPTSAFAFDPHRGLAEPLCSSVVVSHAASRIGWFLLPEL